MTYKNLFVPYNTREAITLSDYKELKREVDELKIFSTYYSDKYSIDYLVEKASPERELHNDEFIPMTSIFIAIVMKYSKCFAHIKKGDRRITSLSEKYIKNIYTEEEKKTHADILKIRNKLIAHPGISEFEVYGMEIGYNENGDIGCRENPKNLKMIMGEIVEIKIFGNMLDKLSESLTKKIAEHTHLVEKELVSISPMLLNTKIAERKELTDRDLK